MFQTRLRLNNNPGLDRAHHINESALDTASISRLISVIRRQARLFIVFCGVGVAFGTLYLVKAKPLSYGFRHIIIDNRQMRVIHDVSKLSDSDNAEVQSQVEVLRSEKVDLAVIRHFETVGISSFHRSSQNADRQYLVFGHG
jgi:uncharacterized protein involved in exopolysaccharide biosynthesis